MQLTKHHNLPGGPSLLDIFIDDLATVYFYEHVVISEVNPGKKANYKTGFHLLVKGVNAIQFKPWVYISNRIHNYEVDPKSFSYLKLAPYIKGAAIVSKIHADEDRELLGMNEFQKPFRVFKNLESAYLWAMELVSENK